MDWMRRGKLYRLCEKAFNKLSSWRYENFFSYGLYRLGDTGVDIKQAKKLGGGSSYQNKQILFWAWKILLLLLKNHHFNVHINFGWRLWNSCWPFMWTGNTYVFISKIMEDSIQTFQFYIFKQTLIQYNVLIQFYYKWVRQYLFCIFPYATFKRCLKEAPISSPKYLLM